VDFTESPVIAIESARRVMRLEEAIQALERLDLWKAQVVETCHFGGLEADGRQRRAEHGGAVPERVSVLDISRQSVNRDWSLARARLSLE
jgi:hypothetical protein